MWPFCYHQALRTKRTHFLLKLKDRFRYTCIKLFSRLSFKNSAEICVFSGLSFKNPGEIRDNPKPVTDSWEITKSREPPGESGRVGSYGMIWTKDFFFFCKSELWIIHQATYYNTTNTTLLRMFFLRILYVSFSEVNEGVRWVRSHRLREKTCPF